MSESVLARSLGGRLVSQQCSPSSRARAWGELWLCPGNWAARSWVLGLPARPFAKKGEISIRSHKSSWKKRFRVPSCVGRDSKLSRSSLDARSYIILRHFRHQSISKASTAHWRAHTSSKEKAGRSFTAAFRTLRSWRRSLPSAGRVINEYTLSSP